MSHSDHAQEAVTPRHHTNAQSPGLERLLWALSRRGAVVTARMSRHPRGLALVVAIDDQVQLTQVFQTRRVDDVVALAESVRRSYEDDGWRREPTAPAPDGPASDRPAPVQAS